MATKFESVFGKKYLINSTKDKEKNSDENGKYYKYCGNFTDPTGNSQNYLIYHEKDDIKSGDIIEISNVDDIKKLIDQDHITNGLYAYIILSNQPKHDDKLYDHLCLAKIKNVLEIGAKHVIIARYINASVSEDNLTKDDNVVSAGIIKKIDNTNFIYNFISSTYNTTETQTAIIGTKLFFSKISNLSNPKIKFEYDDTRAKYEPSQLSQSDVADVCSKKDHKEVLIVDKCDSYENNDKIVNVADVPSGAKTICSAATYSSSSSSESSSKPDTESASDTAAAEAAAEPKAGDDEAANTEARKIVTASKKSIEIVIEKINTPQPIEYLGPIGEKMTELLQIMNEIKI
jgi:hypothetical protein